MPQEIEQLKNRVKTLEDLINNRSTSFNEKIRDIVMFDIDNSTSPTQVAVANLVSGSVTVGKIPLTFARVYFRGKPYNVALYALS